ncbi:hypothetical protein [Halobellus inordinatus]|uniref:hypothetical protein n=1 Tax=Halobellus inordinatus TaxID=1126236 RepID=UPI0021149EE2|nr:hypothetical protein [Halobellus ramosii]
MNSVTTVAAALKAATLGTEDGDLVLDFPGGEKLRLRVHVTEWTHERSSAGETVEMDTEVDYDPDGSWWMLYPERSNVDGEPGQTDYPRIDIDPHLENVGDDVDRGEGIESDGGWLEGKSDEYREWIEAGAPEAMAAKRLADDTDEVCDYDCDNQAEYRVICDDGIEFVCCQRCSDYNRVYAKENDLLDADYAAAKARYKDVETDGGQPLPSDYDAEDGFDSSRGVDTCPHCGVELAPQTGRHAPVFDQAGRKYGTIFDTDPMDRPFFCEECWQELDANQKASENESLERFATDGGEAPECDADGCTTESAYLLAGHGNLCEDCARERAPETVGFIKTRLAGVDAGGDAR